jgi:hypothetical protein
MIRKIIIPTDCIYLVLTEVLKLCYSAWQKQLSFRSFLCEFDLLNAASFLFISAESLHIKTSILSSNNLHPVSQPIGLKLICQLICWIFWRYVSTWGGFNSSCNHRELSKLHQVWLYKGFHQQKQCKQRSNLFTRNDCQVYDSIMQRTSNNSLNVNGSLTANFQAKQCKRQINDLVRCSSSVKFHKGVWIKWVSKTTILTMLQVNGMQRAYIRLVNKWVRSDDLFWAFG